MKKRIKLKFKHDKNITLYFDPDKIVGVVDVKVHRNIILGPGDFYYSVPETVREIFELIAACDKEK
jgi:hypothetical protein